MADETTTPAAKKPGWQTSEFWLKIAAITLTALFASDVIPTDGPFAKGAAILAIMLGALGYTVSRTMVKLSGLLLFAMLATQPACAWLKSEGKALAGNVVDCTTVAAKDATKQFGPVVDALLAQATDGAGKVNWQPVKDVTKGFGIEVGGCVLATVVARALKPAPADPNAPKASELAFDRESLRAGFDQLRVEQFGGRAFLTEAGVL